MAKCEKGCRSGHLFVNGAWVRCSCLEETIYKRDLGAFATKDPIKNTALIGYLGTSLMLEGPLPSIRMHVAGAMLHLREQDKTFTSMDAYRLVEIFLDKDEEFGSSGLLSDYDLFVMLLGFGEVKNQRLPDLIAQVLQRRALLQRPTWVVLGIPLGQVATRFTQEVSNQMATFKKVAVK